MTNSNEQQLGGLEKWFYRILLGIVAFFSTQFFFDIKQQTEDIQELKLSNARIEEQLKFIKEGFNEIKSEQRNKVAKYP
jgi:cell division protein FtsL